MTTFCDSEEYRATIPTTGFSASLRYCLEINSAWSGHVFGAIISILDDDCYWLGTDEEIYEARQEICRAIAEVRFGSAMPLLTVYASAGILDSIPDGHVLCNGLTYTKADYPQAYDLIHINFKDEVNETFVVPNLIGRFVRHIETGFAMASQGGEDTHVLTTSEMPAHTHSEIVPVTTIINGGLEAPANAAIPSTSVTGSTGGGQAHENRPRFVSLRYWIVLK